MAQRTPHSAPRTSHLKRLVPLLLVWYAANARDLPWRRTRDPYAIWVSEIMLQQTQVKTVIPFWNRWLGELPTIQAAAKAPSAKIHKLWEGLGYYTRVRNLQKAAQVILEQHDGKFPDKFADVWALPGIGRYTAGAICSIAFNQPTPILDGNVVRVLTRIFGISENPKVNATNTHLWQIAEGLVKHSSPNCSHLNQSLMELGALVCTPRNPQCLICPVQKLCLAFKEGRMDELPSLGKRESATVRRFIAFVIERNGHFLVRQRPAGIVNAHLWEFPNVEVSGAKQNLPLIFETGFGVAPGVIVPLVTVKHSITRYRVTLEAFLVQLGGTISMRPRSIKIKSGSPRTHSSGIRGCWKTPLQMQTLAFTAAHKKLASAAAKSILSGR